MTPAQLQQFKEALAAEKFDPGKRSDQYEFQRGWNAALEFAEQKLKQAEGDAT